MHKNTENYKVALVTGAARRVGAEIAKTLHAANMNVILHYGESQAEADALAVHLNQLRENSAYPLHGDLSHPDTASNLIIKSAACWGRLDVLVNNASKFYATPISTVRQADWNELMNTNLAAPFFLSQAAAPMLAKQGGAIVNIIDIYAQLPLANYSIYCLTKSALAMLTKSLAIELGPHIRVNGVSPGAVSWPEGENSLSDTQKQKIIGSTALKRHGCPKDIAKAVLFFVKDAEYVTGQILPVDGGRSLSFK